MSSDTSNLDERISHFFSNSNAFAARSQCDTFAHKTFGGPVEPVPTQGVFSYTVTAANGTIIVQFREPSSPLDAQVQETVQNIHPNFVTGCAFHGTIGSSPGLLVYSMKKLLGDSYLNVSLSIEDDDLDHRLATVRSLSRFFAQSWQNPRPPDPIPLSGMLEECTSAVTHLRNKLPSRFQETITQIQENLPSLFSGEYPLVLTHGDLSEMNMLANPETGEIKGIIDWAEAGILPFGFALYALDHILGYLSLDGWVVYDHAEQLRAEFWRVFRELVGELSQREVELIQLARLAGVCLRYGIPYKPGCKGVVGIGPKEGSESSFAMLDAFIHLQ